MAQSIPQIPQIGDFVLHQSGAFYGEVVGYGKSQTETSRGLTLKVDLRRPLIESRLIVMEDLASNWWSRNASN